jgi:hypothetical protein
LKFLIKSSGKSLWTSVTGWWSSNYVRWALNALGIVVLLICAVYLELPRERKAQSDKCVLLERGDSEESATFYAKTATSGYRRVRSRRVTLVPLREDVEPSRVINNVCEQRWYVAKLVKELNAAGATSIVLDKFFGPDSCPEKDPGTLDLIAAIDSSRIPVMVGAGTHTPQTDPRNVCLIESPTLDFGNKHDAKGNPTSVPAVLRGLVRLNSDVKKIPINWFSYRSDETFNAHEAPTDSDVGTLSWVAATQLDRDLQDEPALERLRTAGQHPFTSFIDPDAFSHAAALGILCASKFKAKIEERYHVDCAQNPRGSAQIEGRVIVIGEDVSAIPVERRRGGRGASELQFGAYYFRGGWHMARGVRKAINRGLLQRRLRAGDHESAF